VRVQSDAAPSAARPESLATAIPIGVLDAIRARAPAKQDFLYNQAISGATCKDLMHGGFRQAPRLVALMNLAPRYWRQGVVVIRIGQNDWGPLIDLQARDTEAPKLNEAVAYCQQQIAAAMALIRTTHPLTSSTHGKHGAPCGV